MSRSLKAICSLFEGSPLLIRFTPLKLESLASCVIWINRLLYCSDSFLRASTPDTVRSLPAEMVSLLVPYLAAVLVVP